MIRDIKPLLPILGFENEEEFAKDAIEEKVLNIRKELFFSITNDIKLALKKKGIKIEQIIDEFEKYREENACS